MMMAVRVLLAYVSNLFWGVFYFHYRNPIEEEEGLSIETIKGMKAEASR